MILRVKKQISDASKFQYDKTQINEMVFKTNCDKIKRGNYKGLNMTEFRISLLGQVDIAESDIREAKEELSKLQRRDGDTSLETVSNRLDALIKKANELKDL